MSWEGKSIKIYLAACDKVYFYLLLWDSKSFNSYGAGKEIKKDGS